jgi:hypothetical protein
MGMELRELPPRGKITLKEKRHALKSASQPKAGTGLFVLSTILPTPYRTTAILGSAGAQNADAEAAYMGFCTFVVTTIALHGGDISDHKMQRYLCRLNADQNIGLVKTDILLKRMEKQQYIVRSMEKLHRDDSGDSLVIWSIGSRAKEDISYDGMAGLIRTVWTATDGHGDPGLEKDIQVSIGGRSQPSGEQINL